MNNEKKKIHIIGAGFSGLSLACLLARTDKYEVTVFEKNAQAGGMIKSNKTSYGIAESAANSILLDQKVIQFLESLNIKYTKPLRSARSRFFYTKKLTRWPLNILQTLMLIFQIILHLITSRKQLTALQGENFEQWGQRNFSKSITKNLLSPSFQGIYAAFAEQLDAELVLKDLLTSKKKKHQGIASGINGLQDITDSLVEFLKSKNVQIKLNTKYSFESYSADIKVVCTSFNEASDFMKVQNPELLNYFKKVRMLDVMTITCFFNKNSSKPKGFGCLIPKNEEIDCLGVLFNSDIFPNRANNGIDSETYIFSGRAARDLNLLSDQQLRDKIENLRKKITKLNSKSLHLSKTYWEKGLPLYNSDLKTLQKVYEKEIDSKKIYLHGNYIAGIGLSKILAHSNKIAYQISKN